jgi:arylformamidase
MPAQHPANTLTNAPTDPAELDRAYNNRALVPTFAEHFSRWQSESARARQQLRGFLDVAYGRGPNESLDLFVPDEPVQGAPVLVFVHGGYWRSLDKADHSFVAPPFVAQGACVVVINYALCPAVTVPDIALQTARALVWLSRHIAAFGGDPARISVVGHSAGGHLAAMMLACDWSAFGADLSPHLVRQAVSISGLFDLAPIQQTPFLQSSLQLTDTQVQQASPAHWPAPRLLDGRGQLVAVVGGDESSEFLRQNALIQHAWGPEVVPVCESLPGLNHFSVLEAMTQTGHRLHGLISQFLRI